MTKPNYRIEVEFADKPLAVFNGDVEMAVTDGVLTIWDYGNRTTDNGVVLIAAPGAWRTAKRAPPLAELKSDPPNIYALATPGHTVDWVG